MCSSDKASLKPTSIGMATFMTWTDPKLLSFLTRSLCSTLKDETVRDPTPDLSVRKHVLDGDEKDAWTPPSCWFWKTWMDLHLVMKIPAPSKYQNKKHLVLRDLVKEQDS